MKRRRLSVSKNDRNSCALSLESLSQKTTVNGCLINVQFCFVNLLQSAIPTGSLNQTLIIRIWCAYPGTIDCLCPYPGNGLRSVVVFAQFFAGRVSAISRMLSKALFLPADVVTKK